MSQQHEQPFCLPTNRAFVLQLRARTDIALGHFAGRIQHVASGQAARFYSVEELLAFLTQVLPPASAQHVEDHSSGHKRPGISPKQQTVSKGRR